MRVKLLQTGAHAPWHIGEIVTVQVIEADDAGAYECETLETYAPDIKQKHADELAQRDRAHAENLETVNSRLAETQLALQRATRVDQPTEEGTV